MLQQQLSKMKTIIQQHLQTVFKAMAEVFLSKINTLFQRLDSYYMYVSHFTQNKLQSIKNIQTSLQKLDQTVLKLNDLYLRPYSFEMKQNCQIVSNLNLNGHSNTHSKDKHFGSVLRFKERVVSQQKNRNHTEQNRRNESNREGKYLRDTYNQYTQNYY